MLLALLIVIAWVTLGSSKGGSPPGSTSGGGGVGTTTLTTAVPTTFSVSPMQSAPFVDDCAACATVDYLKGGQTQGRKLTTDVWYPTLGSSTSPAPEDSSSPLVVFAAGYDLLPSDYQPLIDAWVEKGFVVAAPVFPDTNTDAVTPVLEYFDSHGQFPGGQDANPENDMLNQPRDVSYVLSQLVQDDKSQAGGPFSFLYKLFDPSEIALAGQSDGASTIAGLLYNSCPACGTSIEPQAVLLLSGQQSAYYSGTWFGSSSPQAPVLVAQSTADACNNPQNSTTLYGDLPTAASKYFLTLKGATHLVPYTQQGSYEQVVAAVTTAFLESELHHGSATPSEMLAAGTTAASSIQAGGPAPALAAVTPTWTYNPGTPEDPCALAFAGPPAGATTTSTPAPTSTTLPT